VACRDGNILIAGGVPSTNLRTFGIESDGERATLTGLFSFACIVNNALVILHVEVSRYMSRILYLVGAVAKVHTNNVHSSSTQLANHFDAVGFGTCSQH